MVQPRVYRVERFCWTECIMFFFGFFFDSNNKTSPKTVMCIPCPLTNAESHFWADILIDVDVTDSLAVAQDRDVLAVQLDLLHQLLGAPWDHQVNVLMHVQQVRDVLAPTDLKQGIQHQKKVK